MSDAEGRRKLPDTVPSTPCFLQAKYDLPAGEAPLFVECGDLKKGVVFVSGHNLGSFWDVGPQKRLWIPDCWVKGAGNELLLFVEEGRPPTSVRIVRKPLMLCGARYGCLAWQQVEFAVRSLVGGVKKGRGHD